MSSQPMLAPLLRWAGSKRKLLPALIPRIPDDFGRYVEPFSGSACLFFAIRPKNAVLSDLNQDLVHAYQTVRDHPLLTWRSLTSMSRDEENYYVVRALDSTSLPDIERAARFIYLNRHCFNGVYRTNRAGKFNVPFGDRLGAIPSLTHFRRCAAALRHAELISGDFEKVVSKVKTGDFVYLDPPYAKNENRQRGEYGYSSFSVIDLDRLSTALQGIDDKKATFLLSYADCNEICGIKERWFSTTVAVKRQVSGFHKHRVSVSEVLISNRAFS
jgi:DNA adenine methylase